MAIWGYKFVEVQNFGTITKLKFLFLYFCLKFGKAKKLSTEQNLQTYGREHETVQTIKFIHEDFIMLNFCSAYLAEKSDLKRFLL